MYLLHTTIFTVFKHGKVQKLARKWSYDMNLFTIILVRTLT